MCYGQYTRRKTIRTLRRIIRQGRERINLIAFAVVDHKLQFIIINIDGIDERFDDVPAEERIRAVAFRELAEEEETHRKTMPRVTRIRGMS